ncbi:MAG TPA: transglutaminase-like domain-containing protein [Methanobacteriaceae archaeon]|nr:transglutaminase-like domain-containing protein [Methanobacteriaceae archaeon]
MAISICFISTSASIDGQTNENTGSKVVFNEKNPVVTDGDYNYPTVNAAKLVRRTPVRSYKKYKKVYSKVRYAYKWVKFRGKWRKVRYVVKATSKPATPAAAPAAGPVNEASMERCLSPTRNCPSNDPSMQILAYQLTTPPPSNDTNTTVEPYSNFQKAQNIYEWTEKNVEYSWYYNSQKGALGVLYDKTANCCDHAHIINAVARAAGLPARYVHGTCYFFGSNAWYGHVWSQIYVDGVWIDADASNNDNDFGVIRNWNTNTWKLNGIYAELPF